MFLEDRFRNRLAELLVFHHIIDRPEELGDNYQEKILAFQEKVDIMVDGNPRWETLWQLQFPWVQQAPRLALVKCEADKVAGSRGQDHLWLRQDAADRYNALRKEVRERGGLFTTDGGLRPLSERKRADRLALSMHYVGLSFDLASDSGFLNPDTDPFVITMGGNCYWEVWCRVDSGPERKLNIVYWDDINSSIDRTKVVQGKFINFTEICTRYGFHPIRPRMIFTRSTDRKYIGCEWWHFQANDLLIPGLSQFGIELLRIEGYTPEIIRSTNEDIWERKMAIYGDEWY